MYTKRRFTTIIYNYNYIYSSKVIHTCSKARKATDYPTTRLPSKRFQASDSTFQAKRRMVSKKVPKNHFLHPSKQHIGCLLHSIESKPFLPQILNGCPKVIYCIINTKKTIMRIRKNFNLYRRILCIMTSDIQF